LSLYLDASVMVPIHIHEKASVLVEHWQSTVEDSLAVSDLAAGEFVSATSRLVRMGRLTSERVSVILARFDQWLQGFERIEHASSDIRRAAQLVRDPLPKLLMADAIHLATCARTGHTLVTLDDDLAMVLGRLGLDCIVPA
jgi:predicted nucleic acid-binding protein